MFAALGEPFSVRAMEVDRLTAAATISRLFEFKDRCAGVVAASEPHVPWDVKFLALRRDCYLAAGDQRAERAARELNEYLSAEPLALASGLRLRMP